MVSREGPSTRCVHYDRSIDQSAHTMNTPIIVDAASAYEDLESWREVALGKRPGDIYSRNSNPTGRAVNEKMAAIEGAESATDFSTGMAAINAILFALLSPGQRAVTIKMLTERHTFISKRFCIISGFTVNYVRPMKKRS